MFAVVSETISRCGWPAMPPFHACRRPNWCVRCRFSSHRHMARMCQANRLSRPFGERESALAAGKLPVRCPTWGCKPEPPEILSPEIQTCHDGVQVDHPPVAVEGVVAIQQDVAPRRRRDLRDQRARLGSTAHLVSGEQARQDRRVVVDDRSGDPYRMRRACNR